MNYRIITYIVGWVFNLQAIFMVLSNPDSCDLWGKRYFCLFYCHYYLSGHWTSSYKKKTIKQSILYKRRVCCCSTELGCTEYYLVLFLLSLPAPFPILLMPYLKLYQDLQPPEPVSLLR